MRLERERNVFWVFKSENAQPGKMSKSFIEQFKFFFFFFSDAVFAKKQVPSSPRELCRTRTVFRVPTCCSWGKINAEQAEGRNAFKAALIELDGLQSQSRASLRGPRS